MIKAIFAARISTIHSFTTIKNKLLENHFPGRSPRFRSTPYTLAIFVSDTCTSFIFLTVYSPNSRNATTHFRNSKKGEKIMYISLSRMIKYYHENNKTKVLSVHYNMQILQNLVTIKLREIISVVIFRRHQFLGRENIQK